jgi:hypothetical protein
MRVTLDDVFVMARTPILDGFVASASMLPTMLVAALTTLSRIPVASAIALCTCWRALDIMAAWPKSSAAVLNTLEDAARSTPCEAASLATFDPPLIMADATSVTSSNRLPTGGDTALSSVFVFGMASRTDLYVDLVNYWTCEE